jgi:hypothetical protein
MAFSFGFASDGASDDEDIGAVSKPSAPVVSDAVEVETASHKLEDLVGTRIFIRCLISRTCKEMQMRGRLRLGCP